MWRSLGAVADDAGVGQAKAVRNHTITAADPCPTTSAAPSTASTPVQVRTKLSQLRLEGRSD